MDKQQQIEEMEDIMNCSWNTKSAAAALYNAGYQKIDNNCAVITKSELKQYKAQAVKEFAERLKTEHKITNLWLEFVALVDIDA